MQKGVGSYNSCLTLLVVVRIEDISMHLNWYRDRDFSDAYLSASEVLYSQSASSQCRELWIQDAASCLHWKILSRCISYDPSPDGLLCVERSFSDAFWYIFSNDLVHWESQNFLKWYWANDIWRRVLVDTLMKI